MKKTVILVVISLAIGILFGMGIGRHAAYYLHPWFAKIYKYGKHKEWKHKKMLKYTLEDLRRKLDLNDEQAEEIELILEKSRTKIETTQTQVTKKFTAIKDDTNTKIRQVLSPMQQEKFDELVLKRQQRPCGPGRRF